MEGALTDAWNSTYKSLEWEQNGCVCVTVLQAENVEYEGLSQGEAIQGQRGVRKKMISGSRWPLPSTETRT